MDQLMSLHEGHQVRAWYAESELTVHLKCEDCNRVMGTIQCPDETKYKLLRAYFAEWWCD